MGRPRTCGRRARSRGRRGRASASAGTALFVGGLAAWALGVRALWRRWDLVDRLAGEGDAYAIPEVREYALRETTMERLRSLAACVRRALHESTIAREERVLAAAEELDALASELEDEELVLEPASAVACARLFSDATVSPLLNASPTEELRSRIAQIRAGFAPVSAPVARAWPPAKRRSNRGRSKKRTPKRRSWAR